MSTSSQVLVEGAAGRGRRTSPGTAPAIAMTHVERRRSTNAIIESLSLRNRAIASCVGDRPATLAVLVLVASPAGPVLRGSPARMPGLSSSPLCRSGSCGLCRRDGGPRRPTERLYVTPSALAVTARNDLDTTGVPDRHTLRGALSLLPGCPQDPGSSLAGQVAGARSFCGRASTPASLRCSARDRRRRRGERVVAAPGLRERDDVADRVGAGEQRARSGPSRTRCRRAAGRRT